MNFTQKIPEERGFFFSGEGEYYQRPGRVDRGLLRGLDCLLPKLYPHCVYPAAGNTDSDTPLLVRLKNFVMAFVGANLSYLSSNDHHEIINDDEKP